MPAPDETGLSSGEARQRLAQFGYNEVRGVREANIAGQLFRLAADPLVVILLLASLGSAIAGEATNAGIIVAIVALGLAINFVQTFRSQRAVAALRQSVTPTATASRDGTWQEIARRDLVPGDLIRLSAGDAVPADARLLTARDLHVQEAAVTGESLPVEKRPTPGEPEAGVVRQSWVYLGTSIVSGTATARVEATGLSTSFGEIAARLSDRPPETEFERGTRRFGFLIMQMVVFLTLLIFLSNLVLKRDALQSLLFSIALAVGLTPEFLPMIVAVTLARGAVHMARRHVVVKHLQAIQNLGSMNVLCSDKTGTLTSGAVKLVQWISPQGQPSDRVYRLAYLNSYFETGIKSPLDAAILAGDQPDIARNQKLDEIPFDFERRRVSIVVRNEHGQLLIVKGAPESVLTCCSQCESPTGEAPLDDAARTQLRLTYEGFCGEGFRVLAVASRIVDDLDSFGVSDERQLSLTGFLVFEDPILPDAARALHALGHDGVQVKLLTGDNELVAQHLCKQVGISTDRMVLGQELESMTDTALGHVAEGASLFARMSPMQKHRVILALKRRGHVVGFLGDGINDAPSLHASDVGISVAAAVDIAKDAAEIILLKRGLATVHAGILEGRRAFGNVMKYLLMGTSSNFGNMVSMAMASFFLPFLPMLPTQILLNNLLYDMAQLPIPTDTVDPQFLQRPHRWDINLIRRFMLFTGPISSIFDFATFFVLIYFFRASEALFHTGWFVESLVTQTLVIFVVRTLRNPFFSRPSLPLVIGVIGAAAVGFLLPYSPAAVSLEFVPLPASYLLYVVAATGSYLCIVEVAKRWLLTPHLS